MIRVLDLLEPHGARECRWLEDDVGVGEQKQFSARALCADVHCVILSEPPGRQLANRDDIEAPVAAFEPCEDRGRPIGGPVVDDDDLEVRI